MGDVLVGPHVAGRTDPRECLALLIPSKFERQLAEVHALARMRVLAEPAPVTGRPPVIDLPALLRKHVATGRFAPPAPRSAAERQEDRADAIERLAGAVAQSACTRRQVHAVAPTHDVLVQTRIEFPLEHKSIDPRYLRAVVKNSIRRLHALRSNARKCGRRRYSGQVVAKVKTTDDGASRAFVTGVVRCASVHVCPTCAATICSHRAEHVRAIVGAHRASNAHLEDAHRSGGVYMLTLTAPHDAAMRLLSIRRGISVAWQKLQQHREWKRLKHRMRFVGSITAREVTHGDANGWHPHLHILLAVRVPWTEDERYQLEVDIFRLWCEAFESAASLRFARRRVRCPSWENGISLVPCHDESYIQKLGLAAELTGAFHKVARESNRTPFEIMADFSRTGSAKDERTLREYVRGIKGARQLTWSRGKDGATDLRVIYADALRALEPGEPEQTDLGFESDLEIVQREESEGAIVSAIPGRAWDALLRVMRRAGPRADAEHWIVTAAEDSGAVGVEAALARAYHVGRQLARDDPRLRLWLRWLEPRDNVIDAEQALKVHALLTKRGA